MTEEILIRMLIPVIILFALLVLFSVLAKKPKENQEIPDSAPEEQNSGTDETDWSPCDVMVGTVRSFMQLSFNLRNNNYYAPAKFIAHDKLPINYIALYEDGIGEESGIMRYAKVLSTQRIRRGKIPVPMSRNNAFELYYYFTVDSWKKLEYPIVLCDTSRGKPQFTNYFLLSNCKKSYQLFSISSLEEFHLMQKIENYFETSNDKNINRDIYRSDDGFTIFVSDGFLKIADNRGEVVDTISAENFSKFPRAEFERIKRAIQKTSRAGV